MELEDRELVDKSLALDDSLDVLDEESVLLLDSELVDVELDSELVLLLNSSAPREASVFRCGLIHDGRNLIHSGCRRRISGQDAPRLDEDSLDVLVLLDSDDVLDEERLLVDELDKVELLDSLLVELLESVDDDEALEVLLEDGLLVDDELDELLLDSSGGSPTG